MRKLAPNVVRFTQSGTAQGPSVARGEVGVGISFVHEFVTQQLAGFEVKIAIPCEGTGDALGGMAILAGAPHPDEARAEIRAEAAVFANAKTLDVDPGKFGDPEMRRRLLTRWQKEIGDSLR
jgi:iron(III) transport system substrate-binding protein